MALFIAEIEGKGRGVFSDILIKADTIIEECPVIPIDRKNIEALKKTELIDYYFLWGEQDEHGAICLGFGSIYNHSYRSNAVYFLDLTKKQIIVKALRDISAFEEITTNYNRDPIDTSPLWFEVYETGKGISLSNHLNEKIGGSSNT